MQSVYRLYRWCS
ncbi:hypothetical protein YPPY113_2271, partial [Yersinia pestis PY-113]